LTKIIVQDREEFSSPLDRGQLNGDPVSLTLSLIVDEDGDYKARPGWPGNGCPLWENRASGKLSRV